MSAANTATVPTFLSIDQYLNTTYRPDVDYVDGCLEERNLGEFDHARVQTRLSFLLCLKQEEWGVIVVTEVRVQVAPTRFRIPDVCVLRGEISEEPIVREAPLLCLEVLSPRDSLKAIRKRAQDYFDMGVPEVWIFDPQTRTAHAFSLATTTEHRDGVLKLEGTEIEISIEEAFKPLKRK